MNDNSTHPIEGPNGPITAEDYFQSPEYQKFVESMVPHCHCDSQYRPCDGVLAGGLCDDMHDREIDPFDNEDDGQL